MHNICQSKDCQIWLTTTHISIIELGNVRGFFFHKIKQSRINCRLCFTEGSQLHADARLPLLIRRHIQYVNRVKNWFVTHNKWFPLLSTRNRVAECAHLAGTTAAEFLEPPQFWGLITHHLQQPAQVSLCHPFPFQGVTHMVPRRPVTDQTKVGLFVISAPPPPPPFTFQGQNSSSFPYN